MATQIEYFKFDDPSLTFGETTIMRIAFMEPVTGLTEDDFTLGTNGILTFGPLTTEDGGFTWQCVVTPNDNINTSINIVLPYDSYRNAFDDSAGSSAFSDILTINTTDPVPNANTTQVMLHNVTADNVINAAEGQQDKVELHGQVTGKFHAGDVVVVTVDGTSYEAQAAADGSFTVMVDGHKLVTDADTTVDVTVLASNSMGHTAAAGTIVGSHQYGVDITPPAISVHTPDLTNQNLPYVTGTTDAGAGSTVSITVTDSAGQIQHLVATVDANGGYSVQVKQPLAEGNATAIATVSDAAGNVGMATDHTMLIDTVVTAGQLVLNNFTDSFNPYLAGTKTDMLSNDRTYDLSVQGAEQGAAVQYQILQNGQWINTTPTQQNMADGSYTYRAVVTDAAGNTATTGNIQLQVDATAPDAPTHVVRDGNQMTGTAEAGSVVVAKSGGTVVGTAVVGADGKFNLALSSSSQGCGTSTVGDVVVQAMDKAGNLSGAAAIGNVYKVYTVASSWNSSTGPIDYGSYKTGAGDDWLQIGNGAKNCWLSITQGNIWNKNPWCGDAVIDTGDGNDRIDTGYGGGEGSMFAYTGVKTGAGDDVFNLKGAMVNDCWVDMGTGNDTMTIGCFMGVNTSVRMGDGNDKITLGGNMLAGSLIDMGRGNDTAILNGEVWCGATVRMGEGNDTVIFSGKTVGGGLIDGGSGHDTLVLTYNQDSSLTSGISAWKNVTNLSTADIKGFEMIKMEGRNVVDVKYCDLLNDTSRSGALFIQGNSNDKVDLGSTNWNSDTYQSLNDAGGGRWAMTGSKVVDGVTYDVYHHSYAGSNTLNDVYVQKGVMVI